VITRAEPWWLFWNKGMFPSSRAKNSENQREYDDVRYVNDEERGRQVNTSERDL
jgi:hypothetical protein